MKRKAKVINFIFFTLLVFSLPLSAKYLQEKACYETRFAFDIGTGTMKSRAAKYNTCTNRVVEIYGKFEKFTHFEACMVNDKTGAITLTEECVNRTNFDLEKFQKEYNMSCKDYKCYAIATAWARKVENGGDVSSLLDKQGIKMKVLTQEEEGEAAFKSVSNSLEYNTTNVRDLVVWDIGGGSFQFSTLDDSGKIHVFEGKDGVESFDKAMRKMLSKSPASDHPFFTDSEMQKVIDYAIEHYGRKLALDPIISSKLQNPNLVLVGVGGPMSRTMIEHLQLPNTVTPELLLETANIFKNKSATEIKDKIYPRIPNHFLKSTQTSLLIHYGIMKGAGIEKISISDIGLVDYVLTEKEFWK